MGPALLGLRPAWGRVEQQDRPVLVAGDSVAAGAREDAGAAWEAVCLAREAVTEAVTGMGAAVPGREDSGRTGRWVSERGLEGWRGGLA